MSIDTNVAPQIAQTANPVLGAATGALVLTAIAIAMVILVQLGVLPWTLSEVDPAGAVGAVVSSWPIS